ncbi:MAG: aminoglycoside 6-adenylyltransferase [Sarcina sp.]
MRDEQVMMKLILNTANSDERVRAVYMNGSRVNPNVKKDIFQDYDIVFVVEEIQSFLDDKNWISLFGEYAIVQEPNSRDFGWGNNHDFNSSYTWLMLFEDGNRIDLHVEVKAIALERYFSDTLTQKLLDKDDFLPEIPPSNDRTHWIKPTQKEMYLGCCNEFWWCLNNVGKGIGRNEIPYAMRMYTEIVHSQLDKMIEWYIGMDNNFAISTGMWGKYFSKYLPIEFYDMYLNTYSDCDLSNFWDAIFTSCELFSIIAKQVSYKFDFEYNIKDEESIMLYLKNIKNML